MALTPTSVGSREVGGRIIYNPKGGGSSPLPGDHY